MLIDSLISNFNDSLIGTPEIPLSNDKITFRHSPGGLKSECKMVGCEIIVSVQKADCVVLFGDR